MTETLRLRADRPEDVARAGAMLRDGLLVAFPTETVYGLGANALMPPAVRRIFAAKQRPAWDPLIVHLHRPEELAHVAKLTVGLQERVDTLAAAFWPGPLTLLLPRTGQIPDEVTAGRELVGVRIPEHPVAQALLRAAGVPVAAPSANRFGHVSPTTAEHVLDDLDGRIDAVLDGGPTRVGVESTVLDPGPRPMVLYRAGAITAAALQAQSGLDVEIYLPPLSPGSAQHSLPSPGVGLRHYAPEARVILTGPTSDLLNASVRAARSSMNGAVGVMLPTDWPRPEDKELVLQPWGRWDSPASLAESLFSGLRALEARRVQLIVCPLPAPGGLGDALRDRLLKAATPR